MDDTKLEYLHSDFFKFILKSPNARSPVKSMASSEAGLSSIAEPVFHIHRDLLASLSPEFRKHTNNEMKEGREHTMELHDVSEKTIKTFIGWAYTGDYITSYPIKALALLAHTEIYVLSDRFNVAALKDLAYSKATTLLADLGMVAEKEQIDAVMEAVTYAFNNLLLCAVKTKKPAAPLTHERLLSYLAQYVAWALDVFRDHVALADLLGGSSDFTTAMITNCKPASTPPWIQTQVSAESVALKDLVISNDVETHILSRQCGGCDYTGVMSIKCGAGCESMDTDIGSQITVKGALLGAIGEDRLTGTQTDFTHTCKWCKRALKYNPRPRHLHSNNRQAFGSSFSLVGIREPSLYCRKCNTRMNS